MTQAVALSTTRPVVEPFTKEQIKAFRSSDLDGIVFHHDPDQDWIGAVVANIRTKVHGQDVEVRVTVPVNSSITNYEEGRQSEYPASDEEIAQLHLRASHLIHYPTDTGGPWRTIAAQLRVGDQIHLRWVRGNYNQITRASGLAVDELDLLHLRNSRTVGGYRVAFSVGSKNCARMVRSAREARTYS
jgi:hypothetical protein